MELRIFISSPGDVAPAGAAIRQLDHIGAAMTLAWHPAGNLLATGSKRPPFAQIWDVRSGARTDLPGHTNQIWYSACSPDGRRLLTAGNNGSLRIWAADAKTGDAPLKMLASPDGEPRQLRWSADGQAVLVDAKAGTALLTTDDKATASLSIVRLDDLLKAPCARATRPFTPAEWALYFPGETYRLTCAAAP